MREILFRGKRMDNGEWVEGSVAVWGPESARQYSIMPIPTSPGITLYNFLVDHVTVGQFTGLCDKNGRRIFEGDKIKYGAEYERESIVVFEQGCFQLQRNGGLAPLRYHNLVDSNTLDGFAIGNIHDNPELLEAKL
jgi:uncharacterized phage protein (TIGR01671 family)